MDHEQQIEENNYRIKKMKDKQLKLLGMKRLEERKVKSLNFNLEELDQKIDKVDAELKETLKENKMEQFVVDTEQKNQQLEAEVRNNLGLSKVLRGRMDLIKRALMRLNSQ